MAIGTRKIKQLHYGAGITPMSHDPDTNERVFLFGSERWGPDSGLYSGFSGRAKPGETPIQTAAREGAEELRGMLGNYYTLLRRLQSIDHPSSPSSSSTTTYPVELVIMPGKVEDRHQRSFYCYFIEVPYIPIDQLTKRFLAMNVHTGDEYEKKSIRWFSISELLAFQKEISTQKTIRPIVLKHIHRFPGAIVELPPAPSSTSPKSSTTSTIGETEQDNHLYSLSSSPPTPTPSPAPTSTTLTLITSSFLRLELECSS